jgi:hypothetical protein
MSYEYLGKLANPSFSSMCIIHSPFVIDGTTTTHVMIGGQTRRAADGYDHGLC